MMSFTSWLANADTRGPYWVNVLVLIVSENSSIFGTTAVLRSLPMVSMNVFTSDMTRDLLEQRAPRPPPRPHRGLWRLALHLIWGSGMTMSPTCTAASIGALRF